MSMLLLLFSIVFIVSLFTSQQQRSEQNTRRLFPARSPTPIEEAHTTTFNAVAGVDEAELEPAEVVEFLRQPQRFRSLVARIPRGVLLIGPPGTGKTLLAQQGRLDILRIHACGKRFDQTADLAGLAQLTLQKGRSSC